jgi:hypothetical protein
MWQLQIGTFVGGAQNSITGRLSQSTIPFWEERDCLNSWAIFAFPRPMGVDRMERRPIILPADVLPPSLLPGQSTICRKAYRHLSTLIEGSGQGSVKLISQSLEYPRTQFLFRLWYIIGANRTRTVITYT